MKLQLDYDNKTIKIENKTSLSELVDKLQTILPDWREWQLETTTITNWANPIYIPYQQPEPRPWWETPYTYSTINIDANYTMGIDSHEPGKGLFNIEVTSGNIPPCGGNA